jgi:hypothetical protein
MVPVAPAPKPIPAELPPPPPKAQEPEVPQTGKAGTRQDPAAVSENNPCGIIAVRSLDKRAERVPDDAANWQKVFLWLLDESGVDRTKIVFWSGDFQNHARDFANANNGYRYYWNIFDEANFVPAFGGVRMGNDAAVNQACSKALALYSRDPLVFNHDGGMFCLILGLYSAGSNLAIALPGSYWKKIELPNMWKSGTITKLKDDAKTPAGRAGIVPTPPKPEAGGAGSC